MVHVQGCTTWPTMQAHAYTGVGNKPLLPVWLYKELHLVLGAEAGVEGGDGLAACRTALEAERIPVLDWPPGE